MFILMILVVTTEESIVITRAASQEFPLSQRFNSGILFRYEVFIQVFSFPGEARIRDGAGVARAVVNGRRRV